MAFQFSLEVAQTGGDIQQELLTLVAEREGELEIQGDKQATTSEWESWTARSRQSEGAIHEWNQQCEG